MAQFKFRLGYSYWYNGATNMHPLRSPSVFNFYAPSFAPNGEISDLGLVAPEFGIYNSRTSIGYANQLYRWLEDERVLQLAWLDDAVEMPSDLTVLFEYAKDPDALMDHLDVVLTQGSLTPTTRAVIKHTLDKYGNSINDLVSKVNYSTVIFVINGRAHPLCHVANFTAVEAKPMLLE